MTVAELLLALADVDDRGLYFEDDFVSWRDHVTLSRQRVDVLGPLLDPSRPPHVGVLLENADSESEAHARARFEALLEAHFRDHWTVADYAQALAVTPTHLSRVARAATGVSAQRLIEARLMREARRNLAYTHLGVATIAYTLGYADPAYFTRAFTRDAGLSPRAFRAQVAASAPTPVT